MLLKLPVFTPGFFRKSGIVKILLVACVTVGSVHSQPDSSWIDGTDGAPLGGFGSGGIKFCAHAGAFAASYRNPCALDNFNLLPDMQFQLYTKRSGTIVIKDQLKSKIVNNRSLDDAVYPIHTANFDSPASEPNITPFSTSLTTHFFPHRPSFAQPFAHPLVTVQESCRVHERSEMHA